MKSKFDDWFVSQFGKRRLPKGSDQVYINKARQAKRDLDDLENKIARAKEWDKLHDAALYAWNLKDKDK